MLKVCLTFAGLVMLSRTAAIIPRRDRHDPYMAQNVLGWVTWLLAALLLVFFWARFEVPDGIIMKDTKQQSKQVY